MSMRMRKLPFDAVDNLGLTSYGEITEDNIYHDANNDVAFNILDAVDGIGILHVSTYAPDIGAKQVRQ